MHWLVIFVYNFAFYFYQTFTLFFKSLIGYYFLRFDPCSLSTSIYLVILNCDNLNTYQHSNKKKRKSSFNHLSSSLTLLLILSHCIPFLSLPLLTPKHTWRDLCEYKLNRWELVPIALKLFFTRLIVYMLLF